MRILGSKSLIFICSALCINTLCIGAAGADFMTYEYRGNKFVVMEGEPGIFTTNDRVTGRFTIDCGAAHMEGNCVNLPFFDYFAMGAVRLDMMSFSAGPATLPTADGQAIVTSFRFSTDSRGRIDDWNIDLVWFDPTGIINVDTDNNTGGPIDSAAALGGGGVVQDDPGKWKTIGRPNGPSTPLSSFHNRMYGNDVGADICVEIPGGHRCSFLWAWDNYDVKGEFEDSNVDINYWFHRFLPGGGWREGWRWISCRVGAGAIKANPNRVTLQTLLDPENPECYSDGYILRCDEFHNCNEQPWGLMEPTEVTGEWLDPIDTSKAVVSHENTFYDPWSNTYHQVRRNCNERTGGLMEDGGFSIGTRHFPFRGFGTQGWSHYWVRACNDHEKVR